jgi:hypothetical protein
MFIRDYITGIALWDTPKERVRQNVERFLIEEKGYSKDDVIVDYEFDVHVQEGIAKATADLLIRADGKNAIVIMCAPPSVLTAYEMLALACARVLNAPLAVATEWESSVVMDTYTGNVICESLDCIPARNELKLEYKEIPEDKLEKSKRILITYLEILHCKGCRIERVTQ